MFGHNFDKTLSFDFHSVTLGETIFSNSQTRSYYIYVDTHI